MSEIPAKPAAQGHIPALDGIRGLAILMVLCVHFFVTFTPQNFFELSLQKLSGYGTLGIDLFFMLSGFLITGILMDTKADAQYLRNFWVRRFLRIFPLYYLVLLLVMLVLLLLPEALQPAYAKVWDAMPWAWTYLLNFYIAAEGSWSVPYIGHFWSLAVEEQFYLVWPLLVYRLAERHLMHLCAALVILSTAFHFWMDVNGISKVSIHVLTPLRLNALCLGAWLAIWLRQPSVVVQGKVVLRRWAAWLFGASLLTKIAIIALVQMNPSMDEAAEAFRTLSWLGFFAALHLGAVALPKTSLLNRGLCLKPLRFLGKYSYGIYVFHHFLSWPAYQYHSIDWLTSSLGHQTPAVLVNAAIGISVAILGAWISYHLFEKHFLRWKDRLAPRVTS
ncbi:acyltransferase family protein [Oligoflexus tunisiensis]|uniref:acyltransferase family protein n=1 Tax=Oligoflexus tunisiensis TaxID=708132 RepID=UPI00114CEAB0|nr:acyltransferase [Oligoflexus tunisiensis]